MSADRFIRIGEVVSKVGLGRASVYRLIALGKLPKPYHPFDSFSARWSAEEIEAWVEAKKSQETERRSA